MSLISWLGGAVRNVEHAVGGAVNGAEQAVNNNVIHPAQQAVQQVVQHPQQAVQQLARPVAQAISPALPPAIDLSKFVINHLASAQLPTHTPVTVKQVAQQLPSAIGQEARAIGNNAPVLSDAIKFGQQKNPTMGDFVKGITSVGYQNSPVAAAERTVGRVGATIAQKPVNLPGVGTVNPINQDIGNAKGLGGKALAVAGIAGDALYGKDLYHAGGKAGAIAAPKVVEANKQLGQDGYMALPGAQNYDKYVAQGKPTTTFNDGVTGVERSDKNMQVKQPGVQAMLQGKTVPLSGVIDHPGLQKDYPQLFDTTPGNTTGVGVKLDVGNNTARGTFDPSTNTVSINPNVLGNTPERMTAALQSARGKQILGHEISHAIDSTVGVHGVSPADVQHALMTRNGVAPTPFERHQAYNLTPAEQRANLVSDTGRMNMSQRQLDKNPIGTQPQSFRLPGRGTGPMASLPLKERGLTTGIKESPNFSPELQGAVKSEYAPATDKAALAAHEEFAKQPLDTQNQQALAHLAGNAPVGKQEVVNFGKTIQGLDAAGRTDEATTLHNLLAPKLTEAGQTGQAAALLYKRTPEGMTNQAMADLRSAKVEVSPELQAQIKAAAEKVDAANKAHLNAIEAAKGSKYGSKLANAVRTADNNRARASHDFANLMSKHLPSSFLDKGLGFWKSGLIDGPQTASKVGVGYAVTAPVEGVSKGLGALVDRGFSLGTGKRTLSGTTQGQLSGAIRGAKAIPTKLKTGLDLPGTGGFDTGEYTRGSVTNGTRYKNKLASAYANGPGRLHAAISKPFAGSVYDNSIADQAHVAARNQGLKGAEKSAFINDFRINPPDDAKIQAQQDAAYRINQENTAAGKLASKLQQSDNPVSRLLSNIVVPFSRIPSAIGTKGIIDYTPLGIPSQIVKQVVAGKFDQRAMSMAIGRSATGSTAGLGFGALLAANGRLTSSAPADTKQKALWDTQGKQPNSILIGGQPDGSGHIQGGKWISLNALGAIGITMSIGGAFSQALKDHNGNIALAAESAIAAGGKTLASQPFLQGISGAANALNDPTRYAQTFVDSTIGSAIPSVVATAARAGDSTVREVNGIGDALKNRIPGLHNTLQPKLNIFGNPIKENTGLPGFIDPFRTSSNNQSDPVSQELQRLGETQDAAGKSLGVVSEPNKKLTVTIGGQKTPVTPAQRTDLITTSGPQIHSALTSLIASPAYQGLSDSDKQAAISKVVEAYRQAANVTKLGADVPKTASLNERSVLAGQPITGIKGTTNTPQAKYQTDLATYNQKKAAGQLTPVEDFKAQQSLGREAITSNYSSDVQTLYSMGKAERNAAYRSDPALAALAPQVAQLSADLNNKNFTATDKIAKEGSTATKRVRTATRKTDNKIASSSIKMNKAIRGVSFKTPKVGKSHSPRLAHIPKLKLPKVGGVSSTPGMNIAASPSPRKSKTGSLLA